MTKTQTIGHKYGSTAEGDEELGTSTEIKKQAGACARFFPTGFTHELKPLLKMSWPLTLTLLTQYTFGLVAVFFCGRLGTIELDSVSMANSLINVVGVSIPIGMSSACDTLFSQIYGSSNKKLAGVVLQRSLLVLTIATVPCLAIHLNAQRILINMGQEPIIAKLTGDYLLIFIPALMSFAAFTAVAKYLQNQKIIYPSMIFGIISNGVNILLHYVFLFVWDWGLTGSAVAQTISYLLMCLLNVLYVVISGVYKETWPGWTWECLQDWGQFTQLALFGVLMTCIEWWSFEAGIFLTGVVGANELGAQSVLFQFETIFYMVPYGVSIGTSVCVGTYLGAGDSAAAKTMSRVGIVVAAVIGIFFALLFVLASDYLPAIFSNDPDVQKLAASALPVFGVFTLFDATACVCGGVVRGLGRQVVGAVVVGVGYLIALCIGIPLLFLSKLSVAGFWIGLATALILVAISYLIFLSFRDWEDEVRMAKERAKEDMVSGHSHDADSGRDGYVDETTALLDQSHTSETAFTDENHDQEPNGATPHPATSPKAAQTLSLRQLLWRRSLVFLVCFGILAVGIIFRFEFPPLPVSSDIPHNDTGTFPYTTSVVPSNEIFTLI